MSDVFDPSIGFRSGDLSFLASGGALGGFRTGFIGDALAASSGDRTLTSFRLLEEGSVMEDGMASLFSLYVGESTIVSLTGFRGGDRNRAGPLEVRESLGGSINDCGRPDLLRDNVSDDMDEMTNIRDSECSDCSNKASLENTAVFESALPKNRWSSSSSRGAASAVCPLGSVSILSLFRNFALSLLLEVLKKERCSSLESAIFETTSNSEVVSLLMAARLDFLSSLTVRMILRSSCTSIPAQLFRRSKEKNDS